jgi:hypothetical protein
VTSTTAFPDPTTYCHTGQQQVLKPAPNTNITKQVRPLLPLLSLLQLTPPQYPSGKIPFQYCTPNYKTTATLNITVRLMNALARVQHVHHRVV